MSNYSSYIPKDLAKELLQYGMPLCKYDLGSYDGKPYFDTEDEDSPNWEIVIDIKYRHMARS